MFLSFHCQGKREGGERIDFFFYGGGGHVNMMSRFTYKYSYHPINFPHSLSGWYDQDGARGVFYRASGEGRWSDRRRGRGGRRREDTHRLPLVSRKESSHQQRGGRLPLQRSVCGSHCATLHLYTPFTGCLSCTLQLHLLCFNLS